MGMRPVSDVACYHDNITTFFGHRGGNVVSAKQVVDDRVIQGISTRAYSISRASLVKIQTYGGIADDDGNLHKITRADLEAVLREAAENWIGEKRLIEIFRSRHPEATEADGEIKPEDAGETLRKTTTGEAVPDTEVAGEVADDEAEQSSETPPHPVPKPKSALSAKDEGNLSTFNTIIKNLTRLASGSAEKYAAATVQTADLETAADFVRAVADLKKKQGAGSSTSADELAADRKQYYAKDKAA